MRCLATSILIGPTPSIHAGSLEKPSTDNTGSNTTGVTCGNGGHTPPPTAPKDGEPGAGVRTGGLAGGLVRGSGTNAPSSEGLASGSTKFGSA